MYAKRNSTRFLHGIEEFSSVALKHQTENKSKIILCPCCDCNNSRGYRDIDDIKDHLIRRGFNENYTRWTWHGESKSVRSSNPSWVLCLAKREVYIFDSVRQKRNLAIKFAMIK